MDDDGYLLVSLLCSYLHTARRSFSFLVLLLHGTGDLHLLGFAPFSKPGSVTRRAGKGGFLFFFFNHLDSFAFFSASFALSLV